MYYVIGQPRKNSLSTRKFDRYQHYDEIRHLIIKEPRQKCKKRRNLVHNPDEEIWYEPYMFELKKEFSDVSLTCDSQIELPWKDIALPSKSLRILPEISSTSCDNNDKINSPLEDISNELPKKKSTGMMELPWDDLLVSEIVDTQQSEEILVTCDSTLEIPWGDLALDNAPAQIAALPVIDMCTNDDIEIPWDDIMIPRNIIIQSMKKRKHPSTDVKPKRVYNKDLADRCRPSTGCCQHCIKDMKIRKQSSVYNNMLAPAFISIFIY